jgi:hypothetical protein
VSHGGLLPTFAKAANGAPRATAAMPKATVLGSTVYFRAGFRFYSSNGAFINKSTVEVAL